MSATCRYCTNVFTVTDSDNAFFEKISPVFAGTQYRVPSPTLCPTCREMRRLTFRNERSLYKRNCDLCGTSMLAMYAPDKPHTVYCTSCWWSDRWDASSYGMPFDPSRDFFAQFSELLTRVPLLALFNHNIENSDFVNQTANVKDCYLIFSTADAQQCLFGVRLNKDIDCVDGFVVEDSELTYECVTSHHLYNCQFVEDSSNCSDSRFLVDCVGCANCLFCHNLRNQSYCVENRQLSKAEYAIVSEEIFAQCQSTAGLKQLQARFRKIVTEKAVHRALRMISCEVSEGDYLYNTKNCQHCFQCGDIEDCSYLSLVNYVKDQRDCNNSYQAELAYECCTSGINSYHTLFCIDSWPNHTNALYSMFSPGAKNILGCIGMRNGENCILNTPYSKEEYETIAAQIIQQLSQRNVWGEFFPPEISPFSYNESVAIEYHPRTKDEVQALGFSWKDENAASQQSQTTHSAGIVPDSIADVDDSFSGAVLRCAETGRPFKLAGPELQFYRKMRIGLPSLHPDVRHRRRLSRINHRHIANRPCSNCATPTASTYSAERPERVFCEQCYLREIR